MHQSHDRYGAGQWNFVSPYLLCYSYDEHTKGVGLLKESGPRPKGSFRLVGGTGGVMDADYLIEVDVPSNTANALVSGLHH